MAISLPLDDRKAMLAFVDRRHPLYQERIAHWEFCRATYDGGRDWFAANLFRYLKEGDREFTDRLRRAYRFNHTREVVDLVTKYIFRQPPVRNLIDAPAPLRLFWRAATIKDAPIDAFMRRACDLAAISGRVWIGMDASAVPGGQAAAISVADEKAGRAPRVYAYLVTVQDMLDYAWDESGRKLRWAKYRLTARDDADPVASSGEVRNRYMVWDREEWVLLEEVRTQGGRRGEDKREIQLVGRGPNPVGEVPLIALDDKPSDDPYGASALIDDIAYLDRAAANYLSNLDAVIQDQTFSQLVIPAQGLLPGEEGDRQIREMGTKRIFTYDGEAGEGPKFISPDVKQAALIMDAVTKIIGEIYHSVGMAGERTKQDNAVGIDNSSGVAKAYDFERVNSLLATKADALETAEDAVVALASLWLGFAMPTDEDGAPRDLVKYPDSYDTRGLYDEFELAQGLSLLAAPDALRREQMRTLVEKLFPRLDDKARAAIEADLKEWPPKLPEPGALGAEADSAFDPASSRQGQVTADTPAD